MDEVIAALRAEVERNETVDGSAKVLMASLLAQVEENKTNPAAIQELVDQFRAQNDSLAAAVAANTGQAPA